MHTSLVSSLVPVRPAVLFRVRSNPSSRVGPSLRTLGDPTDQRTVAVAPGWRVVTVCRGGA
jgi:hypothetical protein